MTVTAIVTSKFLGLDIATGGFPDGVSRVQDLTLGEWLGLSRPRKIREAIGDAIGAGIFNDSDLCPVRGQTSPLGGRPATEYWLTQEQALFFAARSETPKGAAVLKALIEVFLQAQSKAHHLTWIERRVLQLENRTEWSRLWDNEVLEPLARIGGVSVRVAGNRINPWFLGPIGRIYELILGRETIEEIRRRNPAPVKGSNHHQLLEEKLREAVGDSVRLVAAIARTSQSMDQFWNRMQVQFNAGPLQLELTGT